MTGRSTPQPPSEPGTRTDAVSRTSRPGTMASNGRNRECPLPPVGELYVFYSRDQGSGESFIVFVIQSCLR